MVALDWHVPPNVNCSVIVKLFENETFEKSNIHVGECACHFEARVFCAASFWALGAHAVKIKILTIKNRMQSYRLAARGLE